MIEVSKGFKIEINGLRFEADGQLITGQERVEDLDGKIFNVSLLHGNMVRSSIMRIEETISLADEDPEEKKDMEIKKRKPGQYCIINPMWSTIHRRRMRGHKH